MFRTMQEASAIVQGLSNPNKMPGWGYSIPADACITGSKLRKIENSVCSKCYAHKGMYAFGNVKTALQKRLESLDNVLWLPAMTHLIQGKYDNYLKKLNANKRAAQDCEYFRIHDSGDILSLKHLLMWIDVARNVPDVKFWLPTRETGIIRDFIRQGYTVPPNMIIRISATIIGEPPQYWVDAKAGIMYSAVDYAAGDVDQCGAYTRDGECGPCRDCWDRSIRTISYPLH